MSMNIAIFFDATKEQQKKLFSKLRFNTIAGWYKHLRLNPVRDTNVSTMDLYDFNWHETIYTPLNMVARGTFNGEYFNEEVKPRRNGVLVEVGEKSYESLFIYGLQVDHSPEFDSLIEVAWTQALESAGIKDYAMVLQLGTSGGYCLSDTVISIRSIASGAFKDQVFVTFFSGTETKICFPIVEDSINPPYRFWDKKAAKPVVIDEGNVQLETIMTLEHAMAAWCIITKEDFEKVKQLSTTDFVYLVNNYDYTGKYDLFKDRYFNGKSLDDLVYYGHIINCAISDADYISLIDLIEDEEYRLEENASVTLESLIND